MRRFAVVVVFGVIGTGAASIGLAAQRAAAQLHGTQPASKISGTASVSAADGGVRIAIRVANVPPGAHGIHIHEHGDCGDAGKAAGGHFNPGGAPHGFLPKDGAAHAHAGDMGNIEVGADGTGTLELTLPGLTVDGLIGHAVILHDKVDDFSQPTGNAGGRIGCGVLEAANG